MLHIVTVKIKVKLSLCLIKHNHQCLSGSLLSYPGSCYHYCCYYHHLIVTTIAAATTGITTTASSSSGGGSSCGSSIVEVTVVHKWHRDKKEQEAAEGTLGKGRGKKLLYKSSKEYSAGGQPQKCRNCVKIRAVCPCQMVWFRTLHKNDMKGVP